MKNIINKSGLFLVVIVMVFCCYNWIELDKPENVLKIKQQKLLHKESLVLQNKKKITETNTPKKVFINKTKKTTVVVRVRNSELDSISKVRKQYAKILANHPFRKTMKMSEEERLAMGLPPNAYNEQEWLYTMNPVLGRPQTEEIFKLQDKLMKERLLEKAPGEDTTNPWEERGPNNVGGRTRALMFAPGSTIKVFAGGVSGGLWVNIDITSAATSWQRVNGVPSNLSITCITVDPNNAQIMYLGTGEVYTWGIVNGNGVYKSIDGGSNWFHIYGGSTGNIQNDITYIQDIIAWNNPSTGLTEVFFGADAMNYNDQVVAGPGWAWLGLNTIGLYRSTDGTNFARLTGAPFVNGTGRFYAPNTFDVDINGKLWMGTKYNTTYGAAGGMLFSTTNGAVWTNVRDFGTNGRVEVACSKTTSGKMYVLLEDRVVAAAPVKIKMTTDGFSTINTNIAIPTSIGRQPPAAADFTRGQNFYDLMIGVDPTNDANVFVGGIEIFKSTNSGTAWTQLTDWTGVNGALDGVHSDQHCMAFASTSRMVFGNDGGVYYSNDAGVNMPVRNTGYNVTQFYMGSINQTGVAQKLMAGAQDNGTQFIDNAPASIAASAEIYGGDGCWNFIDTGDQFMISSYVYNVYRRHTMTGAVSYVVANNQANGDFVNQCGLDSANDILYANGTSGATYQIYRYTLGAAITTATATLSNALLNNIPTFFRANPFTTTTLLVGTATGRLLKITGANGGAPAWSSIGDASWLGAISDIRYGTTANDIFVTFHNFGVVSVWYSADGGTSWQNKEGDLPNMPVKCILQNPLNTNEVIIGTEIGVWRTSNFLAVSPNWLQSYNGMSDVKVMSFDYRAIDKTILAATFGRGMFTGAFWTCGATTTTWDGATWSNGLPTKQKAIVLNANYDTAVNGGSFSCCSLTVNGGKALTIQANNYVEIGTDLTVNVTGSLLVSNQGSLVMISDAGVITNNGSIQVQKTTPSFEKYDYTYWSSPAVNATFSTALAGWNLNQAYQYDTASFIDLTGPGGTGGPDGFDDNGNDWVFVPSGTTMSPGKGYAVMGTTTGTFPMTANAVFNGTVNNGIITQPITLSGNAANVNDDWNLVGNPYPSAISGNDFIYMNPNISGTLYFWSHIGDISNLNPGTNVLNFSANDYAMYNLSGGTKSSSNSALPNGFIASGEGFMLEAITAGSVIFKNSLRSVNHSNNQFFKGINSEVQEKNRFWLSLQNTSGMYSQQLIGYFLEATNAIDRGYDGLKQNTNNYVSFYSLIDNVKYGIQGRADFNVNDVVPIGYTATVSGDYSINMDQFEGIFENQNIFIQDFVSGVIHNLKIGPYTFATETGTFNDRFVISYVDRALGTSDFVTSDNNVGVAVGNQEILIKSKLELIKKIMVYDVLGRLIFEKKNVNNTDFTIRNIDVSQKTLIVNTLLENGQLVTRKILF